MTTSSFTKKIAALFVLVSLFAFSGIVVFQLQTALGWTNPIVSPPQGAGAIMVDPNTGNVGMMMNGATPPDALSVNGTINAMGNLVHGVATPVAGTDAVNKDYVDLQVAGAAGGGKPVITVYGVSTNATVSGWAQTAVVFNQTIKNCLLGAGSTCSSILGIPPPVAGANVSCPAGWSSIKDGYGPYAYLNRQYAYTNSTWTNGRRSTDGEAPPPAADIPSHHLAFDNVGVTYSICGEKPFLVAQTDYGYMNWPSPPNLSSLGAAAGMLTACVPQASGVTVCNTCKICQQN